MILLIIASVIVSWVAFGYVAARIVRWWYITDGLGKYGYDMAVMMWALGPLGLVVVAIVVGPSALGRLALIRKVLK